MSRYLVTGPERIYVDRVLDDGSGPSFPEHDVFLVDAPTAHAAKWGAFQRAKELRYKWYTDLGDDHPLRGVRAENTADWPHAEDPGDVPTDNPEDAWGRDYVKVDA